MFQLPAMQVSAPKCTQLLPEESSFGGPEISPWPPSLAHLNGEMENPAGDLPKLQKRPNILHLNPKVTKCDQNGSKWCISEKNQTKLIATIHSYSQ